MDNSLTRWFGQVTTGHGFMIIAPTVLSVLSGAMSWTAAAPLLVAGAIGLVWPENLAMQSAGQAVATDVAGIVNAYNNANNPPMPGPRSPV